MDLNAFEAELRRDDYEVEHDLHLEAGRRTTGHTHPFDVRALVTRGDVTITVDGVGTTYRAGDRFDVPANEEHAEAIGAEGVTYLIGRRRA